MFIALDSTNRFIALAQVLFLVWQLTYFIDLKWEKWKLFFIAIATPIFFRKFLECIELVLK